MTATLEYGYRTGRQDPEPRVALSDEPEGRQTTIPQQEGLQAEKVIKGLFTGTFNFDISILAAANRTPLKITGTLTNATNSATTGPVFGMDITMNRTAGVLTLIRGSITPSSQSGDNFLLFNSGSTARWRLSGDGRIFMPDGLGSIPTLTFINETQSGIYRQAGVAQRWFLTVVGNAVFEVESVNGANTRRVRCYGGTNSFSEPQICQGGDFNNSLSMGLFWNESPVGNPRVHLVNGGQAGISVAQPTQSAAAAFRVHVTVGGASLTAAAGNSAAIVRIGGQQVRGTGAAHPQFNTLHLESIDDGPANAGLLTDSTTLYIEGSPVTDTQGKVSNFRAIWVRAPLGGGGGVSGGAGGGVDFDGDFIVTGTLRVGRAGQGNSLSSVLFGADLAGNVFNMVKAGAGNHPRLAFLEFTQWTAGGVATHTDATTIYLPGAPNTSPTGGQNRAIWVRSGTGGGLVEFEGLFRVNATFTAAVGANATLVDVLGTITEAGSGTHARLSLIEFAALGVTAGAATVTDATTVYIAGAPAATVTGKNRALWVAAGETELAGVLTVGGLATFAVAVTITTGGLTVTAGGLTVTAGGILVSAGGCDVTGTLFVRTDRGLDFRNQTNQAAANVGTLNNAPAAGDPAFWVPIVVNGTNRSFPAW